jgi:two-component system, sensor histidine kinase FlrB
MIITMREASHSNTGIADLPQPGASLSPEDLSRAFSLFSQTSEQLALAYHDLQGQVEKLTEELAIANGELARRERLSALGEVAARLAHQLRTPLSTALLYAAQLAQPRLTESDRVRFAEKTVARLRHLERLVGDMLLFVRGGTAAQEQVRVADLLNDVAQIMEPHMESRGIGFHIRLPDQDVCLQASRKDIAGALANLIENAMHASEPGGSVEVEAARDGSRVCISVRDTGRGIAEEHQARLFDPFFTTRQDGTGLGLAIVRNVAEAHGGEVRVSSLPGRGTTFELLLPCCPS